MEMNKAQNEGIYLIIFKMNFFNFCKVKQDKMPE